MSMKVYSRKTDMIVYSKDFGMLTLEFGKMMETYLKFFDPVSYETGMEMSLDEAHKRCSLLMALNNNETGKRNKVRLMEELFRVVFYSPMKTEPIYQGCMAMTYAKMEEFFRMEEEKVLRHFRVKWLKYINEGVVTDWVGMDGEDNEKDKNW